MKKLADISVFETLMNQANQQMGVFNDQTNADSGQKILPIPDDVMRVISENKETFNRVNDRIEKCYDYSLYDMLKTPYLRQINANDLQQILDLNSGKNLMAPEAIREFIKRQQDSPELVPYIVATLKVCTVTDDEQICLAKTIEKLQELYENDKFKKKYPGRNRSYPTSAFIERDPMVKKQFFDESRYDQILHWVDVEGDSAETEYYANPYMPVRLMKVFRKNKDLLKRYNNETDGYLDITLTGSYTATDLSDDEVQHLFDLYRQGVFDKDAIRTFMYASVPNKIDTETWDLIEEAARERLPLDYYKPDQWGYVSKDYLQRELDKHRTRKYRNKNKDKNKHRRW